MEIQLEFSQVTAIYAGLFVFGIGYNTLVAWLERKHYMEGYTAFAVVVGVGVTVGMMAIVSWRFALITIGAFLASGLPMLVGSIWRYVSTREMDQQGLREDVG